MKSEFQTTTGFLHHHLAEGKFWNFKDRERLAMLLQRLRQKFVWICILQWV